VIRGRRLRHLRGGAILVVAWTAPCLAGAPLANETIDALPKPVLVFVHSPLVGPATWSAFDETMRQYGDSFILVPSLREREGAGMLWPQHVRAVADAIHAAVPRDHPVILVAHSGAGVLLPAIAKAMDRPISGYIFVDAIIPEDGKSRLDLFESRSAAKAFRKAAVDGLLPVWTDADLKDAIRDDALRARFVAELRPLPLRAYEEKIPVFSGWPDAPCAYLLFTPTYESMLRRAADRGWPTARLDGTHFEMLNQPARFARALLDLVWALPVPASPQTIAH
jgi:hypothetical protein